MTVALQDVPDYAPINEAYSVATMRAQLAFQASAKENEMRARRAFEVAREQAIQSEQTVCETGRAVKVQVLAQYGSDSPVLHAVGLKQRSERKRPARRAATTKQS
jgi:hypothetical protein